MKKNKQVTNKENLVKSVNKNVRSSTRKIGLILTGIVGKKVDHALRDLTFANQRICKEIKKTIHSAVANAENNFQYDIDNLFIKFNLHPRQYLSKFRPEHPVSGVPNSYPIP